MRIYGTGSVESSTAPRFTIAHCIHGLGLGGAQRVLNQVVLKGDKKEFRFVVYCAFDGLFRKDVEAAGATVRILPRRIPKLDPLWIRKLFVAMRHDQIDLVHTHLFGDSLHGYIAARACASIPVVMTLHSTWSSFNRFQRFGYRWLFRRCERAVACSNSVRESYLQLGQVVADKCVTIPNGIDLPDSGTRSLEEVRGELGIKAHETVIASIGRLVASKGQKYLVSAFARMVRSTANEARLIFLGDGPLREDLEQRARHEGIIGRVAFLGTRADLPSLLPAIDVVVFSSLFEGLSIAMLEAMAAARCIVGTDAAGVLEAVRDEREALIVPRCNVEELSAALARVVESPELRAFLARSARLRHQELFTAQRMVQGYQSLYREVLSASRARRKVQAS